jgi:hypothetical protein
LKALVSEWGVDVLLVDDRAFEPGYLEANPWLTPYPATARAAAAVAQGRQPLVARAREACVIAEDGGVRALDVPCLLEDAA